MKKQLRFTTISITEISSAGVLLIISIILLWSSVSKWFVQHHVNNAIHYYDSNQREKVEGSLHSALSWDSTNISALLLLAKIETDKGNLDKAEELYTRIINSEADKTNALIGLGIIYIKRADNESSTATALDHIAKAQKHFQKALSNSSSSSEAQIGIANAHLLEGNIKETVQTARDAFGKVDFSRPIIKESLIDYYAGVGKLMLLEAAAPDEMVKRFRSAYQYSQGSISLLANLINAEAEWAMTIPFNKPISVEADLNNRISGIIILWQSNPEVYKELEIPTVNLITSVATAMGTSAGATRRDSIENNLDLLSRFFDSKLEQIISDLSKERRTSLINNIAISMEYKALLKKEQLYRDNAIKYLKIALSIEPDDYTLNRNLAVLLRRKGNINEATTFYKKAAEASKNTKLTSIDMEKLNAYFKQEDKK